MKETCLASSRPPPPTVLVAKEARVWSRNSYRRQFKKPKDQCIIHGHIESQSTSMHLKLRLSALLAALLLLCEPRLVVAADRPENITDIEEFAASSLVTMWKSAVRELRLRTSLAAAPAITMPPVMREVMLRIGSDYGQAQQIGVDIYLGIINATSTLVDSAGFYIESN
ncbi:hypothetical protein CHU98_g10385 [Xylaria longipes]|nr:hypothetical protein CHU98_g10385 [Xylaria longipes]